MRNIARSSFLKLAVLCLPMLANAATPQAIDRGPLAEQELATPISVTLTLALPKLAEAEELQQAMYTPGSPEYRHFLTADQFAKRFAPSDGDIARIVAALAGYRLTAVKSTATTIKVTGMPVDMERAFSTTLHKYEVVAHENLPGYAYRGPATPGTIPPEIQGAVTAVIGLDNRPVAHPHIATLSPAIRPAPSARTPLRTGKTFGHLTVLDFVNHYDVAPLYSSGITGSGRTIGIMTLASFTPSDAFTYWADLGIQVSSNRLSIVNVDGGPGAPSDASGSIETTLDVENSGGVAPGAKIIVYQAPNTGQGFLDLFAGAIDANQADTLSTSWGLDELFQSISPVTVGSMTESFPTAAHTVFLQAALQGQTVFAASGDNGAYDVNGDLGCYGPYSPSVPGSCSLTLTVDYPASDSLITAAGGTTLAGRQSYCLNSACTAPFYQIETPRESAWGWDYLDGLCKTLGYDPISCGIFPGGSGGGVSVLFPVPSYQSGLAGIQTSQPGQDLYLQPYGLLFQLPAGYAGRNVPDISANADPETGYVIYYTSSTSGFGVQTFFGGTSFVAPQFAGVAALLDQSAGQRVGFLNPALYGLASSGQAYGGTNAPLNQVTRGDNWFYTSTSGYDLAAGLGTVDVDVLVRFMGSH